MVEMGPPMTLLRPLLVAVLHVHTAAALLTAPRCFTALHRPVDVQPARLTARMAETAEELLTPDKWTEAGYESIQALPAVCKRLNQKRAEAEHLGITLLADRSMGSRVISAAGADPKKLRDGFEAYAASQPKSHQATLRPGF